MKTKHVSIVVLGLLISPLAIADTLGFEVGGYQWSPDYSGVIASSNESNVQGTSVDIQDDLGYSDDSSRIVWAKFEHPIPFFPNVKLVNSDLDNTATSTLTRSIIYGGETFNTNQAVSSVFNMSNTEFTFYYEVLDNWLNLDMGLTIRKYDGNAQVASDTVTEREVLDFSLPLIYLSGRADLPFTGFFIDGEINVISYDGDSVSDTSLGFGYESELGLGAKAGYRTFDMDVEEDSFSGDVKLDGAYISVFYHF